MTDRTMRWAPSVVLTLLVVVGALASSASLPLTAGSAAVGVGAAVLVGPPDGLLPKVAAFVLVVAVSLLCLGSATNVGWFALCVVIAWGAIASGLALGLALTAVSWAALALGWLVVSDDSGWTAWFAGTLFALVVATLVHRERLLMNQLRAAQAGLDDRARAEERNRIAREMHDVIGHALTVSLLHVSSARLALDEDPDMARASLVEAERLAQQSLAEVRAAVGLMRDSTSGEVAPMPGVREIEGLVESFRKAGTPVSCEVVGDPATLTATGGLTVYRILQEALTNVARHAPGSPATVRVEVADAATRVTVDSAGAPGVESPDGAGLIGMRERTEALGGRLSAGPWQAGWRVEAVLPG